MQTKWMVLCLGASTVIAAGCASQGQQDSQLDGSSEGSNDGANEGANDGAGSDVTPTQPTSGGTTTPITPTTPTTETPTAPTTETPTAPTTPTTDTPTTPTTETPTAPTTDAATIDDNATADYMPAAPAAPIEYAPLATGPCITPVTYGAIANDGLDDAVAFQKAVDAAIAAKLDVCIGAGTWNLARRGLNAGSIQVLAGSVTLRGVGPSTILRMTGDGQRRSWRAIYIKGAHDVALRDLAIDGLDATNTEEQTHLVELGPDTRDVQIARVSFGPMRRPEQAVGEGIGGDCVRLLGDAGHELQHVSITDSHFVDCDRSGVSVQRGISDLRVERSVFSGTGDSAIDFEPTGRGAITDVLFADLQISQPAAAQCAWAITMTGTDADLASRLTLTRSVLDGGGVSLLNVNGAELTDNTIIAHATSAAPTITVFRATSNIRLAGNRITRPATAAAGYVFRASNNNGMIPSNLVLENNTIIQNSAQPSVASISAGTLTVRANTFSYAATDATISLVQLSPDVATIANVAIENNAVRGAPAAMVVANARSSYGVTNVSVRGNRASLAPLRCSGPASMLTNITVDQAPATNAGCTGAGVQVRTTTGA